MSDIVLATLNAKYIHSAFGLRYLLANLGPLQGRARLLEFDIHQRPLDVVEAIVAEQPRIVGLGVYIWNVALMTEIVALLKLVEPRITLILGGPEVSHEVEQQPITHQADYVITGEADLKFAEVCQQVLADRPPADKVIAAESPVLEHLALPYELYDQRDIAHRIIYVEASRGCPFSCEFCLSSLEGSVRRFPLSAVLAHLERLLGRGVTRFKFVDRTFNLDLAVCIAILRFFHERYRPGLFLHFEMIPDRLPRELREIIARFPAGALQFEVGIQSFNPDVCARIQRRQDFPRLEENLRFLREHTGVHLHADLIVGLPGESLESFAAGFDRLVALGPQEIQVGILKRLRGVPIARHDAEWQVVYSPHPPYEMLRNRLFDFAAMQRLCRFARYWNLVANSGNFVETTPRLWSNIGSAFAGFLRWSDWLFDQQRRTHAIALARLAELLFQYLTQRAGLEPSAIAAVLWRDYQRGGRSDKPEFLRAWVPDKTSVGSRRAADPLHRRQARHLPKAAERTNQTLT